MRNFARLALLIVASLLFVGFTLNQLMPRVSQASQAGQAKKPRSVHRRAQRGDGRVNFSESRELKLSDAAAPGSNPTNLVSADFDSDNIADLAIADGNGRIRIRTGASRIISHNIPQAGAGQFTSYSDIEPFQQAGKTFGVSTSPDFLFDGD